MISTQRKSSLKEISSRKLEEMAKSNVECYLTVVDSCSMSFSYAFDCFERRKTAKRKASRRGNSRVSLWHIKLERCGVQVKVQIVPNQFPNGSLPVVDFSLFTYWVFGKHRARDQWNDFTTFRFRKAAEMYVEATDRKREWEMWLESLQGTKMLVITFVVSQTKHLWPIIQIFRLWFE